MKLREATQSDMDFIAAHPAYEGYFVKEPSQVAYAVTLEQDNDVVAVGGLVLVTPACAWCWCEITTFAEEHKIELVRNMRAWLDMMVTDLKLSRLQAWVDCERPEAARLVEHLGFQKIPQPMQDFLGYEKHAWLYVKLTGK